MKLEIIKKAWQVKDVMAENSPEWDWMLVYADTATEARKKSCLSNARAKREPHADKVMFEGREITKGAAFAIKLARVKKEVRTRSVMRFPEDSLFYIQHGFVGNCISFWGLGDCGYVTDITQAQKYTREEVLKQFTGGRDDDKIWLASEIEQKIKSTVDSQHVDYSFSA